MRAEISYTLIERLYQNLFHLVLNILYIFAIKNPPFGGFYGSAIVKGFLLVDD